MTKAAREEFAAIGWIIATFIGYGAGAPTWAWGMTWMFAVLSLVGGIIYNVKGE